MADPLGYFITFTTYGAWLHGDAAGSVDRQHNILDTPFLPPDPRKENARRKAMSQPAYELDEPRRLIVLKTVREVCRHRGWKLWAVHVRSNHVHVVVTANAKPEKVMADLKAWASRRLREACGESVDRDRWTQHGSTRYLNTHTALEAAVVYVVDEQGKPMACFDSRTEPHEPEA
jgi:REP element-mobilizing transposase RayT